MLERVAKEQLSGIPDNESVLVNETRKQSFMLGLPLELAVASKQREIKFIGKGLPGQEAFIVSVCSGTSHERMTGN